MKQPPAPSASPPTPESRRLLQRFQVIRPPPQRSLALRPWWTTLAPPLAVKSRASSNLTCRIDLSDRSPLDPTARRTAIGGCATATFEAFQHSSPCHSFTAMFTATGEARDLLSGVCSGASPSPRLPLLLNLPGSLFHPICLPSRLPKLLPLAI